jgi:Ca-activated chloride channel family protein
MKGFARTRERDRIGMVVFGSRAYPVCPLTLDHDWLLENLRRVEIGMVEDGTAIGSGLIASLNILKKSDSKSRVIVLLTDGRNNAGEITTDAAAGAARALGVKIYAVGMGSRGTARYPVRDPFGRTVYKAADADIDEETLTMITSKSGGRYFRAIDMKTLRDIYQEIDRLEKTKIEETVYHHYRELFPLFLLPALCLLFLEVFLKNMVFRTMPS